MIIMLKGANFAGDNIGQVEIPRELDEFTVEFLTHYTKVLTDAQKIAVDDFLTDMRSSGIWDKMSMIFFPLLAASLEEAFYNPAGLSTAPTSYKGYGLSDGGLVVDLTNGISEGVSFNGGHPVLSSNTIDVSTQGFHYAMLSEGNGENLIGSYLGSGYPILMSSRARIYINKADVQFTDTNITQGLSLHMCVLEAPSGGNISADNTYMMAAGLFADKNNYFVSEAITADNAAVYNKVQPLSAGNLDTSLTKVNTTDKAYLWSVGKALTKQEALLYHQYCEALKTAFGLS